MTGKTALLLLAVAALLASACTLDGSGAPTPTFTLLATFPPAVAPTSTPELAVTVVVTQVTEVAQIAVTQVGVTQVGVTQVAVVNPAPVVSVNCTAPTGWLPYTVVAGDTLGMLAISTFTSVAELASANCVTNPDLIYVGQTLYIPRTPGTFLPTPIVDGANVPTIDNILVEPAIVMSGIYTVTPGEVTVRASSVSNATSVTFYTAPTGAESTPVVIGTDNNLTDGATAVWQVSTAPQQANVWAIASSATGEQVTSEPILVQANI
jgi:LysM repeat protein